MLAQGIPKGSARRAMSRIAHCVSRGVEIPYSLLVTMIRMGSSLPGRDDQMRHVAKSPSAAPASPPVTMVMPSPPWRLWTQAVPGACAYCVSMVLVTGQTFHARMA